MDQEYKKQVKLLLNVLPEVAKEKCFALHGGTAINLFIRDMPRLSVDIDLTYLPIEDRQTTINNIAEALARIKESIKKNVPNATVSLKKGIAKLIITTREATVKLEVNLVGREVPMRSLNYLFYVTRRKMSMNSSAKYRLFRLDSCMVEKFVQPWIASIHGTYLM